MRRLLTFIPLFLLSSYALAAPYETGKNGPSEVLLIRRLWANHVSQTMPVGARP